jgi:hypothetical protein
MPKSSTAKRVESDIQDSVFDVGFFLRASQRHVQPTHPGVVKLIAEELGEATTIIANLVDLHLQVGTEPIEVVRQDPVDSSLRSAATLKAGAELAIHGIEGDSIILATGKHSYFVSPAIVATTLNSGGEIFRPEDRIAA